MHSVSVIIPVLNEEKTISNVINIASRNKNVREVIVVDDYSSDNTVKIAKESGAKAIYSAQLGKGASMRDGLRVAKGDIIVYLDGDLRTLTENVVDVLTEPILKGKADFVKSKFGRKAGRITELVAKPLLALSFPELSFIEQPLSGMIAVRKRLLKKLKFENDYGVDIGLLIDIFLNGAKIKQVDIGKIDHKMKPWYKLKGMASQVAKAILKRARSSARVSLQDLKETEMVEEEFEDTIQNLINETKKIVLFDMDGVILKDRFIFSISKELEIEEELSSVSNTDDNYLRTKNIAQLLKGASLSVINKITKKLSFTKNIKETIKTLKQKGYVICIVTDSYSCVSDIVKNKVGADFSIANKLEIKNGVATGEVRIPFWYVKTKNGCARHNVCKLNALAKLSQKLSIPLKDFVAIGDNVADTCMLEKAGIAIAFMPKHKSVVNVADFVINRPDASEILKIAP